MSQSKTVRVLVYTHTAFILGVALLTAAALVAVVVLAVVGVIAVYAGVLYVVGEALWRQMNPHKLKKWVVTNLSELQPRPVLAFGFHDSGERFAWPTEVPVCEVNDRLAVMDGKKTIDDVEFKPLKLNQAEGPYGWTNLDLPTEPTPTAILGHDENGKGEIIDMTLADLPISSTLVKKANHGEHAHEDREAKLATAIDLVQGGLSIRRAAKQAGAGSESTLRGRIKKLRVPMTETTA